jgi:hypothetical protein
LRPRSARQSAQQPERDLLRQLETPPTMKSPATSTPTETPIARRRTAKAASGRIRRNSPMSRFPFPARKPRSLLPEPRQMRARRPHRIRSTLVGAALPRWLRPARRPLKCPADTARRAGCETGFAIPHPQPKGWPPPEALPPRAGAQFPENLARYASCRGLSAPQIAQSHRRAPRKRKQNRGAKTHQQQGPK